MANCRVEGCTLKALGSKTWRCHLHMEKYKTRVQACRILNISTVHLKRLVSSGQLHEMGSYRSVKLFATASLEKLKEKNPYGFPPWKKKCGRKGYSNEQKSKRLFDLQAVAQARGGECLATEYKGFRTPVMWKCAEGHTWSAYIGNVVRNGSWCPRCFFKYTHRNAPEKRHRKAC